MLFIVSIAFALIYGRQPERLTALFFTIALAGSATLGIQHMPGNFATLPIKLVAIDAALMLCLVALAIRANRVWIIGVAACQILAVLSHVAKAMSPLMMRNGYAFLITIWSWPMTLLLLGGTIACVMRQRHRRIIPDWKAFSEQQGLWTLAKRRLPFGTNSQP